MTRDFSQFLPPSGTAAKPRTRSALEQLGWQNFFAQQTSVEVIAETPPVRVVKVHRSGHHVLGDGIETRIPPRYDATVGDWLLLNQTHPAESIVLARKSLFQRRAAGRELRVQLIAANIDTVFITTSCNQDFNVARLERYLALAYEAEVEPVILLTKADLCEEPTEYIEAVKAMAPDVAMLSLNAKSHEPREKLAAWCKPGHTVAMMGSSGVGKSTLVNALMESPTAETAAIRQTDGRGRHTTTGRHLHILPDGFAVLDTPGMRELQLTDAEAGVAGVFSDITDLAMNCRFNDCRHDTEPGCAVRTALEIGEIDEARLARWRKLVAEERLNSATLAERRAGGKAFARLIKEAKGIKRR